MFISYRSHLDAIDRSRTLGVRAGDDDITYDITRKSLPSSPIARFDFGSQLTKAFLARDVG